MTFEARVQAVMEEGFTARQARFLVTVMLHAGVCMRRQYCTFGGMVHGQTARDFFTRLTADRVATAYSAVHKRARIFHIHHRRLYAAIGEPHSRLRKPLAVGLAMERLMILDAVLAQPDVPWLATEREKLAHFTTVFGTSLPRERLPHVTFGTGARVTRRFFPDRLPIGVDTARDTHTFLYLATRSAPVDLRGFLHRHAELLRRLPRWKLRVLFPRHLESARERYAAACRQELATPLRLAIIDELQWYFDQRHALETLGVTKSAPDPERLARATRAFASDRFRALYRAWRSSGPHVLHDAGSPVLADALERQSGTLEFDLLARPYLHLSPLVGTA